MRRVESTKKKEEQNSRVYDSINPAIERVQQQQQQAGRARSALNVPVDESKRGGNDKREERR